MVNVNITINNVTGILLKVTERYSIQGTALNIFIFKFHFILRFRIITLNIMTFLK